MSGPTLIGGHIIILCSYINLFTFVKDYLADPEIS